MEDGGAQSVERTFEVDVSMGALPTASVVAVSAAPVAAPLAAAVSTAWARTGLVLWETEAAASSAAAAAAAAAPGPAPTAAPGAEA